MALRLWSLLRGSTREVITTALVLQAILVLGSFLEALIPGGYVLGVLVGLPLMAMRLADEQRARSGRLNLRLPDSATGAEALLVLTNHADQLSEAKREVLAARGVAGDAILLLAAVPLLGIGLLAHSPLLLVGGSLCVLPPSCQILRYVFDAAELRAVATRIEGHTSAAVEDFEKEGGSRLRTGEGVT